MAFSEELAERIRQGLARRKNVEEKRMFGGIGFLLSRRSESRINPTIRKPAEGRTIAVVGDVYRFLATGEDTNGKYALWEAVVPPGGGPSPTGRTEMFQRCG